MSSSEAITLTPFGPVECRILWEEDIEPYDVGDAEDPIETARYIELYGVFGCVVQTRGPVCPCCSVKPDWETAASLWSIVGDAKYHAEIERELLAEIA